MHGNRTLRALFLPLLRRRLTFLGMLTYILDTLSFFDTLPSRLCWLAQVSSFPQIKAPASRPARFFISTGFNPYGTEIAPIFLSS